MPDELRSRLLAAVGARYEVSDEIGRGGMGVVYRARDVRLRRAVAIKLLPPELAFRDEVRSRFLREAQTAAQLSHPNVVPIYSVDEVDGLVFFVMALVEGDSLGTHLKREGRVSVEFARKVLRDVAEALGYAHGRAIIHRDIKPDNILMDRVTGRTLVSDFGIARAAEGDSRLTATGVTVGTPAYMSPEQAIGERDIDGRSDLYSLGVVGYHMLTGELPFSATNTPAMLMKHINQAPRPIRELRPDLPPGLERAIERAMAKQPDRRWADAAEFREALFDDSPRPADTRSAPPAVPVQGPPPNAAAWPPQPPATHRAVREVAPPAQSGPPAPVTQRPPWLESQVETDGSRPPIPAWMPQSWRGVRQEWWELNRDQRRMLRRQWREQRRAVARGLVLPPGFQPGQELPVEYRIRAFRAHIARVGTTAALLAGINMVTSPVVPWF
ncbi:MAG TPA: serine/threonine-protein kinase, partial [Gemmatimonadaceae bacterium]|nr:serine/threonine-protein kinase [Gemmatimonadaceae bacterium]